MNDATYLRTQQYRDASNLNSRIALHQRFSTNTGDLHRWLFDHLLAALSPDARILEVGCGPADLWRKNLDRLPAGWRVTLTDFSPGMIAAAQSALMGHEAQFSFQVADTQALPFADASFDTAIANYMLYHVPDRPRAIAELARVLTPDGHLFAATNGENNMRELTELIAPYLPTSASDEFPYPLRGFTLQNGAEQLAPCFSDITIERFDDGLRITEAAPLVAYVRSMPSGFAPPPEQIPHFTRDIEQRIATDSAIHITKETGLFSATKAR
jgi:ubiquinone/menaquinone biosynthesis C-methylase UbiE